MKTTWPPLAPPKQTEENVCIASRHTHNSRARHTRGHPLLTSLPCSPAPSTRSLPLHTKTPILVSLLLLCLFTHCRKRLVLIHLFCNIHKKSVYKLKGMIAGTKRPCDERGAKQNMMWTVGGGGQGGRGGRQGDTSC